MKILSNMATVELSDPTTEIEFLNKYRYFHVQNLGDAEIKMSLLKDADTDGSISCLAGNAVSIPCESRNDKFYISGAGKINVIASDSATNPYRVAGKGGGVAPGPTPSPEVLDFLPRPEGIYGYWDYEHGVENTTWTDRVNGNILTCNTGSSFSIVDNSIKIIGGSNSTGTGVNLNLSKNDFFVIYFVLPLTNTTFICKDPKSTTVQLDNIEMRSASDSENLVGFRMRNGGLTQLKYNKTDSLIAAFIKTPLSLQIITKDKISSLYAPSSSIIVQDTFGLSYEKFMTSILLSTETNNIDHIQANLKALEDKYFPT